jgi:hypothetical protein
MTIIDIKSGGQYELWLVVGGGKIIEHTENDGYAVLRHGLNERNREITLADVRRLAERYSKPDLVAQVVAALAPETRHEQ